jgi:hypothetical protein
MKILSSILTLLCAFFVVIGQESPKSPASSPTPVPQQLRILSQPDAPLRIASADVTWATPSDRLAVQVYPLVENVSGQSIRAYSTRRDSDSPNGQKVCLSDRFLPGKILRPGQKTGRSTWQNDYKLHLAPAIWIDYVELSDGTVWGKDECELADYLDGARTGARSEREILLKILQDEGPDAVVSFIHQNLDSKEAYEAKRRGEKLKIPPEPPSGHSKRWEDAFATGALGIASRVLDAIRDWGITKSEIEIALRRPYDASESRERN